MCSVKVSGNAFDSHEAPTVSQASPTRVGVVDAANYIFLFLSIHQGPTDPLEKPALCGGLCCLAETQLFPEAGSGDLILIVP